MMVLGVPIRYTYYLDGGSIVIKVYSSCYELVK